jgi:hypothetical protein
MVPFMLYKRKMAIGSEVKLMTEENISLTVTCCTTDSCDSDLERWGRDVPTPTYATGLSEIQRTDERSYTSLGREIMRW